MINIEMRLAVMPTDKIPVPGCEPTSALSSDTLARSLACGGAIVDLAVALAAIPGSKVEYLLNGGGIRRKYFVFPPFELGCPCNRVTDYYAILRSLASAEAPVVESYDSCNTIGMGYCPSPDFQEIPSPDRGSYFQEGTSPIGAGILINPPRWGGT